MNNAYKINLALLLIHFSFICGTDLSITLTGLYVLGANLASTPVAAGNIINITSSDVILDLDNHVVFQTNAVANVDAIVVNAGLTNVTIRNGTIRQLAGQGILINQGCSNIELQNLTIENCGTRGINFAGAAGSNQIIDSLITNCMVRNCANGAAGDFGLWLQQTSKTNINGCQFYGIGSGSTASGTTVVAIEADNCASINFNNIIVAGCTSPVVTGVRFNPATNSVFSNCFINQNSGNTATGFIGIRLSGASTENKFDNCIVYNNTNMASGFNPDNATAVDNYFMQCHVLRNPGTTLNLVGYQLQARTVCMGCSAIANSTTSGTCFGFQLGTANSGLLLGCIGNNNASTASIAVGLNIVGTSATWVINKSQFSKNIGITDANSFGIRVVLGLTNLFTQNFAFNNGIIAVNQTSGIVAGAITAANTTNLAAAIRNLPVTNMQIIP